VIFVNIFQGLEDMNVELVEMAQAYSTPRYRILKEIYLPSLLPALVSALSIAFAFAWKSSVFAEFIASSSGIGYQLSRANSMMATDRLFAWTIVLILFMLFVEYYLLDSFLLYLYEILLSIPVLSTTVKRHLKKQVLM
jgi:NitT/TauT family transport system permease protein